MKTLYDQVKHETDILNAVNALIIIDVNSRSFRNDLRRIKALPEPFMAGQVCEAWLEYKLNYLRTYYYY